MPLNVHQAFFAQTKESNPLFFLLGARILAGVQKPEGKAHDPFLLDSAISYSYL
jgi:hypothetical protein